MTPQAAKAAATDKAAAAESAAPAPVEQDVTFEEALELGVWPTIGLAPMDDTDLTVEGVTE